MLPSEVKRTPIAVALMHFLEDQGVTNSKRSKNIKGFTYAIDDKGTVLFTLGNGVLIRDMGDQMIFSAHDSGARNVGLRLAQLKWGKEVELIGNRVLQLKRYMVYDREPGIER